jgi:hypothetical protein
MPNLRTGTRKNPKYPGKEETIMASEYIGKIKNQGQQKVEAPHQIKSGTKKGTVQTGKDLRTGK